MLIPIRIALGDKNVETPSMIDSGAGGTFIDQNYARKFNVQNLDEPVKAFNVDGTENKKGTIKSYVDLEFYINDQKFSERFYVTGLGKQKIIFGLPWLRKHNPIIDWKAGTLTWRPVYLPWRRWMIKKKSPKPTTEEIEDEEEHLTRTINPIETEKENIFIELIEEPTWIRKINVATELAIKQNEKKIEQTDEEMIPPEYHEFLDIFSEEKAHRFPKTRSWDHKIEMKEGFEPKSFKNYNLTPAEQLELDKFLKENLEKGYIRPSQSPMASPFFFVSKKDGKLRPCQDYRYLNDWTIKNSYPLPLISDIMDKLKDAKYFTKLDVQWGYNNVRI